MRDPLALPASKQDALTIPSIYKRLALGVLLINLFVLALVALWLSHSRQQDEKMASVVTQNLTQVLANQIGESIGKTDITLLAVTEEYLRQRATGRVNGQALNVHIERARARLPEIDALRITAASGELAYGTGVMPGANISLADRPHFIRLRDDPKAGLVFSKPQISRVNNKGVIVLARRINRPDGSFGGMAFAAIQLEHLSRTFSKLDVGPRGITALRDEELGIIARYPEPGGVGSTIGNKRVANALHALVQEGKTAGTFKAFAGLDNVERVYSFSKIDPYPIYAFVGLAAEDYLAEWRGEVGRGAVLIALFALVTLIASWLIYRGWMRLTVANAALTLQEVAFINSQEAIIVTDDKAHILDVNPAFTQITGYRREEALGQNPRILQSGRQDAAFYLDMWRSLLQDGRWEGEFSNRRKNGEFYIQHAKISAVRGSDGRIVRFVAVAADVTQLKESQDRVAYLAYHDPLTNLPNRALLADRLKQSIAQADRRKNLLAVCYLDLDGFKPINDLWGHDTGDRLLVEVGRRLNGCVRTGDTVARLGGDEFVVLLGDAKDTREVEQAVRRILFAVASPFHLAAVEATLTASAGVTIYPHDCQDPDTLIRHADQAMYAAKQLGKNRFHLFDSASDRRLTAHLEVVARVEEGLTAGEFCLYYQPKVDMRRGVVVGVEALLRWHHPHQGLLGPAMFLPIVETNDFSIVLGEWVIAEALGQLAKWADQGIVLPVSINVSGRHLQRQDFHLSLARLLKRFPTVKPEWVELEILETTAMDDIDRVSAIISACSALGVSFALDDFGTGYSSLTYFRRLPTHLLKIDQSFVRDMLDDPDDLAIVEGVVGLAHTFQRQVIAEGVETIEHGVPLMHFGCDLAQGYAIARPMPAAEVPGWIESWQAPAAWQQMAAVRWSRDDFPLLLAEIHHRRWIDRMAAICEGTTSVEVAPPLGTHQCRFGQWLYGVGKKRYGRSAAFKAIEPIHDKVHALGSELLALLGTNPAAARARIPELYAVREELERPLEQLKKHVGMEQGLHQP